MPALKKVRFEKKYRHPELDKRLSKQRTRAEVRSIQRLAKRDPDVLGKILPVILFNDDRVIIMTRIMNSRTACTALTEYRKSSDEEKIDRLLREIGTLVGKVHDAKIIHGDLTTSNILVDKSGGLVPIDFGLSFTSDSSEDRAVDLYVLERALQSTQIDDSKFTLFLESYKKQLNPSVADSVLKKLEEVRSRGRKRLMIG